MQPSGGLEFDHDLATDEYLPSDHWISVRDSLKVVTRSQVRITWLS